MSQVQDLCALEPINEWSGILVYHAEGSITDVDHLVVTPKYIKLMDIGSKSYTEYDFGPMAIEVFDEYPEALTNSKNIKLGHIHSHNTMGVFFSGTDMDELTSNSPHHFMYLSVIVNNRLDVDCKIGLYCEQEVDVQESYIFSVTDINGKIIPFRGKNKSKKTVKSCIVYNCDIVFPKIQRSKYFNVFCDNYKKIQDQKKAKAEEQKAAFAKQNFGKPIYQGEGAYYPQNSYGFVPGVNLSKQTQSEGKSIGSKGKQASYVPLTKHQIDKFDKVFADLIIQIDEETGDDMSEVDSIQALSIIFSGLKPHEKSNVVDTFTSKFYEAFVDIGISESQTMVLVSRLCTKLNPYRNHEFINSILEDLGML